VTKERVEREEVRCDSLEDSASVIGHQAISRTGPPALMSMPGLGILREPGKDEVVISLSSGCDRDRVRRRTYEEKQRCKLESTESSARPFLLPLHL